MAAPVTTGRIDPSGIAIPEIALEDGEDIPQPRGRESLVLS